MPCAKPTTTVSEPTDCCGSDDDDNEVLFDVDMQMTPPASSHSARTAPEVDDEHATVGAEDGAGVDGRQAPSDKHGTVNGVSWAVDDCALAMKLVNEYGKRWKRIAEVFNRNCAGPTRNHQQIRCWWWRHVQGEKTDGDTGKSRNRCRRCGEPKRGHICKNSTGMAMKRSAKHGASALAHAAEGGGSTPQTPPTGRSACPTATSEGVVDQPSIFDLAAPTKENAHVAVAVAHSMPPPRELATQWGVAARAHVVPIPLDVRTGAPKCCIDLKNIPLGSLAAAVPMQPAAQTLLFNCFVK